MPHRWQRDNGRSKRPASVYVIVMKKTAMRSLHMDTSVYANRLHIGKLTPITTRASYYELCRYSKTC